jgi:hypothetical protein
LSTLELGVSGLLVRRDLASVDQENFGRLVRGGREDGGDRVSRLESSNLGALLAVKAAVPSAIASVEIDPIVHSILIGKKGAKIATR